MSDTSGARTEKMLDTMATIVNAMPPALCRYAK